MAFNPKILGIDKNQYTRLLITTANNISETAISNLEVVTELSKRKGLTAIQVSIPIYMLEKISRISDVKQQLKLIQIIESDLQLVNDTKFCWMTPEQIESILQLVRPDLTRTENKREESTIAEFVEMDDIGKKSTEKNPSSSPSSPSSTITSAATTKSDNKKENPKKNTSNQKSKPVSQKTRQIIDTIPNMAVIPDGKGQPDYLVDKKNGAVIRLDNKATKGIIKTEQVPSKILKEPFTPIQAIKACRPKNPGTFRKIFAAYRRENPNGNQPALFIQLKDGTYKAIRPFKK